jgi:large subunit ribosomal protein L32e
MSEKAKEVSKLKKKKPDFSRHESFALSKLGNKWRRPKGDKNSQRKCFRGRATNVSIGFGSAKSVRGLNKFGMKEVLIHNISELEGLDPKINSAVIGATVGKKKRMDILKAAGEKNIRVENKPRV